MGNCPVPLPYSQSIVGDPESGIVHGGGVSALLEHTAIIKILIEGEFTSFPKMVNLLIKYLRPYLATQDTYAAGTLFKQGRSVICVRVEASQGDSCYRLPPRTHNTWLAEPLDFEQIQL